MKKLKIWDMFKFFKRRNKKRVGFETWDISTGACFRVINNEDSIQYVNEEDKAKPKSQSYKIFADIPIAFRAS